MKRRNTIRQRLLFIVLLLCVTVSVARAQEQEQQEEKILQAGVASWHAYGLSFTLPEEARMLVETDTHCQLRTLGMNIDIDINVLDRTKFTDEELGQEVLASALRGGMDLKTAHGAQVDNNVLQGGILWGMVEGNSHAFISCLEHIHTTYAFFIVIQSAEEDKEKAQALLYSCTVAPLVEQLVRK